MGRGENTSIWRRIFPESKSQVAFAGATGYCVKERKRVEIKEAHEVTMKNGRPALQGVCPNCGTKIFKMIPE